MLKSIDVQGAYVGAEAVERMVRLDVDPGARVGAIQPLCCISQNSVLRVDLDGGMRLVCKVLPGKGRDTFEEEAYQLAYLRDRARLPVPEVLAYRKDGAAGDFTYLILGYVPGVSWPRFQSEADLGDYENVQRKLGDLLGRMHAGRTSVEFRRVRSTGARSFASWPEQFARTWQHRVDALIRSERLDGLTLEAVEWVHGNLFALLSVDDIPRLIHGHLTGNKILCAREGDATEISAFLDPALCYGHHEVDLAALELDGSVGEPFFESYARHMPLDEGYGLRKYVYMLYFVLDSVRLYGNTHDILRAVECSRQVLQRCRC